MDCVLGIKLANGEEFYVASASGQKTPVSDLFLLMAFMEALNWGVEELEFYGISRSHRVFLLTSSVQVNLSSSSSIGISLDHEISHGAVSVEELREYSAAFILRRSL
ncbi:hypothetical protein PIB30_100955 [Stylosanthes scabra]|uniref:Uncharacterized protein n=1 Tax=Stylosanthes scabra TaxID=79078 RepID=A0ABU6UW76_9FABA|nr:hypothetical protein [Stylosanthes scabra]